MVIDTSALLAILLHEPDAISYARAVERAEAVHLSAASYLEAGIVIDNRQDPIASRKLDALLDEAGITIEPVTADHAKLARAAHRDFGKGRHRAGLNFGDCLSYALAQSSGERLLYKGDDFLRAGLANALDDRPSGEH